MTLCNDAYSLYSECQLQHELDVQHSYTQWLLRMEKQVRNNGNYDRADQMLLRAECSRDVEAELRCEINRRQP